MSAFIILFCTGLSAYWISRARILMHGSEDEIRRTLDGDLARGRKFLLRLRLFVTPVQMAG